VTVVSLPARGRPPQAAARRAGIEFVEELLTRHLKDHQGTAERNAGMLLLHPRPAPPLRFGEHYRQIARPFDWTFTRADLQRVLAKITEREPRLAVAA
jgi:hypothetical protein